MHHAFPSVVSAGTTGVLSYRKRRGALWTTLPAGPRAPWSVHNCSHPQDCPREATGVIVARAV